MLWRVARQRLSKHIPAEANESKSRESIARQRLNNRGDE
jgi:hypothetical protein